MASTISFVLGTNPKWYIADLTGKPLGGGFMAAYSSLNFGQIKLVFQDPGGALPYPTQPIPRHAGTFGIVFDENGMQGPFYFQVDTANPDDHYFLRFFDADGLEQFTILPYIPNGTGGGGDVKEIFNLENQIINGQFWRNIDDGLPTPIPDGSVLVPSQHDGFGGSALPDITMFKLPAFANDANDTASFPLFTVGDNTFSGQNDVTPVYSLHYVCSNVPASDTQRAFKIPVVFNLQNLNNLSVTITLWTLWNGVGSNLIKLQWYQFYGDGPSAAAPFTTDISIIAMQNGIWTKSNIQTSVPIPTTNIGECGNSALYLLIEPELGHSTDFNIALPALYIGANFPNFPFEDFDRINAIISSPRTGDIRTSINSFSPYGWVPMKDGTIGDAASNATARHNVDTFPLFNLIWNLFSSNQTLAPMFTNAIPGVPIPYGVDAVTDFVAHRQLSLTRNLGRVMAGALPVAASQAFTRNLDDLDVISSAGFYTGMSVTVSGSVPNPLVVGDIYYAIIVSQTKIALALTTANALSGAKIPLTSPGTGTIVSVNIETLGSFIGEESHVQSIFELANHNHSIFNATQSFIVTGGGAISVGTGITPAQSQPTTDFNGSSVPATIMQPTVYMNVFIKL